MLAESVILASVLSNPRFCPGLPSTAMARAQISMSVTHVSHIPPGFLILLIAETSYQRALIVTLPAKLELISL